LVVDQNNKQLRSIADDEGRDELFTTFGQSNRITQIKEASGIARYAILVLGTSPENIIPSPEKFGWITIDVPIAPKEMTKTIPDWLKQNAAWWCTNQISDTDFTSGIEFMIKVGIVNISSANANSENPMIPQWVKNNACWWSEEIIGDEEFANGITHLIKLGIISV
jgi:hypothetical protein